MSKRLVMCCDGTWNTPDQQSPTNVTKMALGVAAADRSGRVQRTFYHPGVGTSRWERIRGGMFGFGLSRNVRDTYRFLVHNYEPGDELFFFGFSRGAFTARSTAGFVRNCGILRREHVDMVDKAYALYRNRDDVTHPHRVQATLFRRSYSHEPRIRFIGVWDTVGALGIPLTGLPLADLINRRWRFHDTGLSSRVDAAFQALAIDEQRGPFRPTLWKPQPDAPQSQRVEQVWFAGVHSDVGGGYPEPELSDITLRWMARRAGECGLAFEADAFPAWPPDDAGGADLDRWQCVHPDPDGQKHTSRTGLYRLIPRYVRRLGATDAAHEYAASSAVTRHADVREYAPPALIGYLRGAHQIMNVDPEAEEVGTTSESASSARSAKPGAPLEL